MIVTIITSVVSSLAVSIVVCHIRAKRADRKIGDFLNKMEKITDNYLLKSERSKNERNN